LQRDADRYVREFFRLMIHGSLRPEYAHDADAELQAMKQSNAREERGAASSPDESGRPAMTRSISCISG
jgi:hypothetical protein